MTLNEYATLLGRSAKEDDREVAQFIRENNAKLSGWIRQFGLGLSRSDREELVQEAVMSCVEVLRGQPAGTTGRKYKTRPDAKADLRSIHNTLQRFARNAAAWNARRANTRDEES